MSRPHVSRIGQDLCSLDEVPELGHSSRSLSLHCNRLKNLAGLGKCAALESVVASSNQISALGCLSSLQRLTSLNLSSNLLADISELTVLGKLERLDVSFNRLSGLQFLGEGSRPCRLVSLRRLVISHNCLHLLAELKHLTQLTRLTELSVCPQETMRHGADPAAAVRASVCAALPQVTGTPSAGKSTCHI